MTERRIAKEQVPTAFDGAAAGYDRLVGANPGYQEHLRLSARRLVESIAPSSDGWLPEQGAGLRLLDLGCGTGASTAALLALAPRAEIVGVDASAGMLARARRKTWPGSVRFLQARAEQPSEEVTRAGPFDGVLAAYLLRNLPDPDVGLAAIRGLLRPGGMLAVHDYSVAESRRARAIWTAVSWGVIIPAGFLVTGEAGLYRYLWRSVRGFDGAWAFERRLAVAGFVDPRGATVPGWQRDIVHTWLARSPREC